MSIEVELERQSYKPGETLRGRVIADGKVELNVFFVEIVDHHDRHVVRSLPMRGTGEGRFEADLPADALPSAFSQHGGLQWEVVALQRLDNRRDEKATRAFRVER